MLQTLFLRQSMLMMQYRHCALQCIAVRKITHILLRDRKRFLFTRRLAASHRHLGKKLSVSRYLKYSFGPPSEGFFFSLHTIRSGDLFVKRTTILTSQYKILIFHHAHFAKDYKNAAPRASDALAKRPCG